MKELITPLELNKSGYEVHYIIYSEKEIINKNKIVK